MENVFLITTNSQSDMIAPNVIDITGPISGETSIAATIFGALFSTKPRAARELSRILLKYDHTSIEIELTLRWRSGADSRKISCLRFGPHRPLAWRSIWIGSSLRTCPIWTAVPWSYWKFTCWELLRYSFNVLLPFFFHFLVVILSIVSYATGYYTKEKNRWNG